MTSERDCNKLPSAKTDIKKKPLLRIIKSEPAAAVLPVIQTSATAPKKLDCPFVTMMEQFAEALDQEINFIKKI